MSIASAGTYWRGFLGKPSGNKLSTTRRSKLPECTKPRWLAPGISQIKRAIKDKIQRMTTLIFFGTIIALLFYIVRLIIKISRGKNITSTLRALVLIVVIYAGLWGVFYLISRDNPVPFGTDICFDDWCATVTSIEKPLYLGAENQKLNPLGQFIVVNIKMSNHARGIAQKPSEPGVHLIDEKGNTYSFSATGQQALEKQTGSQIPIDERLELNQSLETKLVFDIPNEAKKLKVLIEEGPFITKLLFNENRDVFLIP